MRQLNYSLPITSTVITQIGVGLAPVIPGFTTNSTRFESLLLSGKYAYVVSSGGSSGTTIGTTLTIYDVSNPTAPVALSYLETFSVGWVLGPPYYLNGSYQMALQGNILYVASNGSSIFYTVNVSNPSAPFNIGHFTVLNLPGALYGVAVQGNYAYLATQNKGLTVINITNPASMSETFQEGGTLNRSVGVAVQGNYAYTTNFQTTAPWTVRYLKIWDITTPQTPVLLTTYTLPAGTKPNGVYVTGNLAFVNDANTNTIQIVDITNPLAPHYLSSLAASAGFNVTDAVNLSVPAGHTFAYLVSGNDATKGAAIDFFDITNPAVPVKLSTYWSNIPHELFNNSLLYNGLLYVADYGVTTVSGTSSLKVFSIQNAFSSYIPADNLVSASVQVHSPNSLAGGVFSLQGSDDASNPVNWNDIPGSNCQLTGAGSALIPKTDLSYQFIRMKMINTTSNIVTVNNTIKAIGF